MQALARYAFGMGTLQMVICTLAFTCIGLPAGASYFSQVIGMRGWGRLRS